MCIILVSRVTMVRRGQLETMVNLEHEYVLLHYYAPCRKKCAPPNTLCCITIFTG
jgi:hypothetical protein